MPNVVRFPVVQASELPPILLPAHDVITPALDGGPALTVAELTQHAITFCADNISGLAMGPVTERNLCYIKKHLAEMNQLIEMYGNLVE